MVNIIHAKHQHHEHNHLAQHNLVFDACRCSSWERPKTLLHFYFNLLFFRLFTEARISLITEIHKSTDIQKKVWGLD